MRLRTAECIGPVRSALRSTPYGHTLPKRYPGNQIPLDPPDKGLVGMLVELGRARPLHSATIWNAFPLLSRYTLKSARSTVSTDVQFNRSASQINDASAKSMSRSS